MLVFKFLMHLVHVSSPAKTTLLPLPTNWSRRLSSVIWEKGNLRNIKHKSSIQYINLKETSWDPKLLAMSMKVGKLPVVKPFNLCIVVVGGSARNLEKHKNVSNEYASMSCELWLSSHLKSFPWARPDVGSGFDKVCSTGSLFWQGQLMNQIWVVGTKVTNIPLIISLAMIGIAWNGNGTPDMASGWAGSHCAGKSHISRHLNRHWK